MLFIPVSNKNKKAHKKAYKKVHKK